MDRVGQRLLSYERLKWAAGLVIRGTRLSPACESGTAVPACRDDTFPASSSRGDEHREAVVSDDVAVPLGEILANLLRVPHSRTRQDLRHRHEACGDAHGIRVEGPRVTDLPGHDLVHDRRGAAHRCEWKATRDRLAEHLDVRGDAERFLRAAVPLATRLDLVENQERADLRGDPPEAL